MRLISTRGSSPVVDLRTALLAGTAPDGGLYVPESVAPMDVEALAAVPSAPYADPSDLRPIAKLAARHLMAGELDASDLDAVVDGALDFPVPLVELEPGLQLLELFQGPTLAFKDVGARFMAQLLSRLLGASAEAAPYTILAATSGDTGSAVADAFQGLAGFRVVVLFPEGGVSEAQRRQFSTLGGNVHALAIQGTFDDCQRLAKAVFADPVLRAVRLTSANSINVGRLLPQAFYHLHLAVWHRARSAAPLTVVVPSGNFGNLAAGVLAQRLGAPIAHLVAATNANDVVPQWLSSGSFEPRPSIATLSNAMDIGNPSNVERIRWWYEDDLAALRHDISALSASDEQTLGAMAAVERDFGVTVDPHTAVGIRAARVLRERGCLDDHDLTVLATAHPAKFAEVVLQAIGREPELPPQLERAMHATEKIEELAPCLDALRSFLIAL